MFRRLIRSAPRVPPNTRQLSTGSQGESNLNLNLVMGIKMICYASIVFQVGWFIQRRRDSERYEDKGRDDVFWCDDEDDESDIS